MSEKYPASILKGLNEVMAEVPYIQKTGKNAHFQYAFASEADVLGAIRPAMVKAGLVLIPSVKSVHHDEKGRAYVTMEYTLAHTSGEVWPEKMGWEGCGQDNQDKAIQKAITSGQKYFLLKLFQVETGNDPDNDGALDTKSKTPPPTPARQASASGAGKPQGADPKKPMPPADPEEGEKGITREDWAKVTDAMYGAGDVKALAKTWSAALKMHFDESTEAQKTVLQKYKDDLKAYFGASK